MSGGTAVGFISLDFHAGDSARCWSQFIIYKLHEKVCLFLEIKSVFQILRLMCFYKNPHRPYPRSILLKSVNPGDSLMSNNEFPIRSGSITNPEPV